MILSPASSTTWPSGLAVLAYLLACACPALPAEAPSAAGKPLKAFLTVGWLAQSVAIFLDAIVWNGVEWEARFGFAPALSVTIWLVLGIYALEHRQLGLASVRRLLSLLAAVAVGLAWFFPGQPHPVDGTPLAPLHWLLGFASYGLFGTALLHAGLLQHAERQMRRKPGQGNGIPRALGMPLLRLESLTFRFVAAGFVILTLTLILGASFATPWRWDHKTVFSVLSWLVFATLIVGRLKFGWRGRQAIRWLIAGSVLLLLAYVGSRFVLEVVLQRPTPE